MWTKLDKEMLEVLTYVEVVTTEEEGHREYKIFSDPMTVIKTIKYLESNNLLDGTMLNKLEKSGLVIVIMDRVMIRCSILGTMEAAALVKLPTYGNRWGNVCTEVLINPSNRCKLGKDNGCLLIKYKTEKGEDGYVI